MISSVIATARDGCNVQVLYDETKPVAESAEGAAIRKTVLTLVDQKLGPDAGAPFALAPANVDVPKSAEAYLKQLTRCASAAATSLACSSILAGHTSEADDYGDVAVWLGSGEYGPGKELEVLKLLGLEDLFERVGSSESQLKPVKLSPVLSLPSTVHVPREPGVAVQELAKLLMQLRDAYAFCVPGDLALYMLVGRHDTFGWLGLAGLGVQS